MVFPASASAPRVDLGRWERSDRCRLKPLSTAVNLVGAKPLKMPERQRVVLGRDADFETDPRLRGELEFGGSNPRVIEPCAQTTHRVRIADFNAFVTNTVVVLGAMGDRCRCYAGCFR